MRSALFRRRRRREEDDRPLFVVCRPEDSRRRMADYNDALTRNNPFVQARTKVLQLKLIGQSHPTGLTANLLKVFEPLPPLEFKPPPVKRKCPPYTGTAQFVSRFAEPTDPEGINSLKLFNWDISTQVLK